MSIAGILRFVFGSMRKPSLLAPGTAAPDFDTTDAFGKPISLRILRGKKIVLWFFPKADTPG
jgi:peroxiredoxin Q/BCP